MERERAKTNKVSSKWESGGSVEECTPDEVIW